MKELYSNEKDQNESMKISIRLRKKKMRSDDLNIKVFTRRVEISLRNGKDIDSNNNIGDELKKEILKKAAIYKKQIDSKKSKNNMWTSKPKKD